MSIRQTEHEDCLFCKIIAGKISCHRVYEDENTLAFLDINPIAQGHALVVPKKHYDTLLEFPPEEGWGLMHALRRVATAIFVETGAGGFNCMQNNFAPAGQTIYHCHWHIIPRFADDNIPAWEGSPVYCNVNDREELAQAIRARICKGSTGGQE